MLLPRRRRRLRLPLALALVAGVSSWSADAAAEWVVRPAVVGGLQGVTDGVRGGGRAGVRLGYNPELEPILILPEIGGSFGYYGGTLPGVSARAWAGVRAGVTAAVEPSIHLRIGYGHDTLGGVGANGLNLQAGLGLDKRIGRSLTLGAAASYDGLVHGFGSDVTALHGATLALSAAFWL